MGAPGYLDESWLAISQVMALMMLHSLPSGQHRMVVFAARTLQLESEGQQKSPGSSFPHQVCPETGHEPSRSLRRGKGQEKDGESPLGLSGSSIEMTFKGGSTAAGDAGARKKRTSTRNIPTRFPS